ncbi:substrate-binding domain-containing protein [Streptomyces sp. DT2A-34]|uniref:LacI family DNA-binding transcriptional regulator n=1 Tax=Streptomyces sp. DT2A-34 TaxID=3051182 RepID=UPI00265C4104|nr:substrate-binding domain-containing protein [Streptomyces sp. DT2A-34]MDO0912820.1 substrate-binding domain-containing protein [Streptomyces sp. DT2A-34]
MTARTGEATAPRAGDGDATHTIGLLYPPAGRDREYTTMQLAFIGGVAEAATQYGYDVLLSPAGTNADASFRRMLGQRPVNEGGGGGRGGGGAGHRAGGEWHGDGRRRAEGEGLGGVRPRVDGVIVMEIRREDDRVEYLAEAGFPFVAIGRNHRADEVGWVDLDFAGLAIGCVRHLADLGHRRIAFVNRSEQLYNSGYGFARLGQEGYVTTMTDLGHEPHAYLCGDDLASGEEVVGRILADEPATTSLVTMNEAALEGVYRGLTRHGRSVPRDFSVVGVAASPWAEQVTPQLTAAEIPAKEMSRVAVELMVERLRSPGSTPRHVLLKPLITLRSSTGRCHPVPGSEPEPEFPDFDVNF